MAFFLRYLAAIVAILAVGLLLERFARPGLAFWWMATAFGLQSLLSAAHLAQLNHWTALPRNRELPAGMGPWRGTFDRLARFVRQEADARAEMLGELERIHAAVDRLPDGLVVLDRFDHVVWSNVAAQELHGIFGARRPIHHFIRQPEFHAMLASGEAAQPIRLTLPGRPGRIYELRLQGAQRDQRLLITRDITEHARLDAMRSDFVANVSHEIRTPVTVIAGFAETLLTLDLDERERRTYLESILRQSSTMQRLVEDLLTLSTLEASIDRPPDDETVDVHEMLRALVDEAKVLSNGRHAFELELLGPRRVDGIAAELESAARNLLTNAIRYTPDGGRISVSWSVHDGEGWISVRDTGIGIAPEHLPRIAERFYRVDRGRSRETGGTGLGLAITKRIMLRHQGSLHVASELGKGSTFSLRLPAARLRADDAGAT
ncbi:phosphate regulon sensor histidine kinase PhoR [Burkholderiaceae bacterium FT117]|uniref:phosphate regulon sensor histidine kinase PhoR n=1 Tax=Zeimonas sediminis TaxID=2944268 RepID=UPI00234316DD|nr:phosphate regulon sensor histidine kinase PhoR [Zeimonas sediminis]MCM5570567.1 phosphate regulon sensor histidine kinase PhoR [Zeimonas sediminis]